MISLALVSGILGGGEISIHKRQAQVDNAEPATASGQLVWNAVEKPSLVVSQKPGAPWKDILAFRIKATTLSNVQKPKVIFQIVTQPSGSCYYKYLELNGNGTTTFHIPLAAMNKSKGPQKILYFALRTKGWGLSTPEELKVTFDDFTIITKDDSQSPAAVPVESSSKVSAVENTPSEGIDLFSGANAIVSNPGDRKVWNASARPSLLIYPPKGKKFDNIKMLRLHFTAKSTSASQAKFVVQLLSPNPDKGHFAYVNFKCNSPVVYDIPVEKMQYRKGEAVGSGAIDRIAFRYNSGWCGKVLPDLVIKFEKIEMISK